MYHNSFFPMLKYKAVLKTNESESENKLTAIVLAKSNF